MRAALALGVRLALGTPGQRLRSALVALAAAVGSLVLLAVVAVSGAERATTTSGYDDAELARLSLVVLLAVGLPVVVLAATVARLSASLRDRRLANLRLLGLSRSRTRLVAAVEAGSAALVGAALGSLGFWLLRALLADRTLTDRPWAVGDLRPGLVTTVLVLAGLPVVVAAVAALPQRLDTRSALERARRADERRPSVWRVLPLATGLGLGLLVWDVGRGADHTLGNTEIGLLFAAMGLTGLGMVAVVPVFVRLLADLVLRWSRRPVSLVTARRLQAQPAAVTRVVAVLMVGLFLVTGARAVVVAFESTPQYQAAAADIEEGQRTSFTSRSRDAGRDAATAQGVGGVREVVTFPVLRGNPGERLRRNPGWPVTAVVATCADLARFAPAVTSCVEGRPMELTPYWVDGPPAQLTFGSRQPRRDQPAGPTLTIPTPTVPMRGDDDNPERDQLIRPLYADVLLPPSTPGVQRLLAGADRQSIVLGAPGRTLGDDLYAAGLQPMTSTDVATYDFVGSLRRLVWTVAGVVLSLGLLTFAIAALDRAVARRREITSLQVIGTPAGLLRRAQWWEAFLPTAAGAVLAVAAGLWAGTLYLRLDQQVVPPWQQSLGLAVVAVAASAVVATLTALASGTRIRPEHVRVE